MAGCRNQLGGEGKLGHPRGAGARGLQPSPARPFLGAESQGKERPLLRGACRFPASPLRAPHTRRRALLIARPTGGGDPTTSLLVRRPAPLDGALWLLVALLGSKKKTELLGFFHFILPHFFPLLPLTHRLVVDQGVSRWWLFVGCVLWKAPELARVNSPGSNLSLLRRVTHACACSSRMVECWRFKPLTEKLSLVEQL